jgi:hypothetical protein
MMMPKRDHDAMPLSEEWQRSFCKFLVQKGLVPQDKAKYFVPLAV